jgi:hypothetical protein
MPGLPEAAQQRPTEGYRLVDYTGRIDGGGYARE